MFKQMMAMLKVPQLYRKEFLLDLHKANAHRMSISMVAIALYLIVIFFSNLYYDGANPDFRGTMMFKITLIIVCLGSAFILNKLRKGEQLTLLGSVVYGTTLLCFLLGAMNSFSVQVLVPNITIFIITIMFGATAVGMTPLGALIIYGFTYVFFRIGFPLYQSNPDYLRWDTMNATISVLVAIVLSFVLFHQRLALFLEKMTIRQQNEQLHFLAHHDGMTKLLNHQSINHQVDLSAKEALQQGKPLCVAVIDIDDFKCINDQFGHKIGDMIIIEIANRIKEGFRETDYVGRYGGDEFVVILPDMNCEEAKKIASRFQETVGNLTYGDVSVTVSVGIAELTETNCHNFMEIADFNLYLSKRAGKNQVTAG